MALALDQAGDGAGTVTIKGKTYHLRKLTVADLSRVRAWLRTRLPNPFDVVKAACERLRPPLDPPADPGDGAAADVSISYKRAYAEWQYAWREYRETRERLLLAAADDANAGDAVLDRPQAKALLSGGPGIAFMLWLAATKDRPGLKLEELEADVAEADLEVLMRALDAVNELPDPLVDALEKKVPAPSPREETWRDTADRLGRSPYVVPHH